jgi:hypothetical protein
MSVRDVSLDEAEPGMILAADLTDGQGSVLLPAGVALSAANLASLRRRGLSASLVVAGGDPADSADSAGWADSADADAAQADAGAMQEREQERERHQARLVRLFRGSAGLGASALLLQLLQDYRRGG